MEDWLIAFDPWWRFVVALSIGGLLGLEREFVQQREGDMEFAGIRTFSLIALLGALVAYMEPALGVGPILVVLLGLVLFSVAGYIGALWRTQEVPGITTEVAALIAYFLGVAVMQGELQVAAAVGVVTALLLALKSELHSFIRRMTPEDIRLTLQFALVAAVVLPLLPNRTVDPWGMINPFQIWMMVVLISGVGFAGYVMMKWLGPGRGTRWTGAIGGLVSSTAVTLSMAARSRSAPQFSLYYAQGVMLAASLMLPRILLLTFVIEPSLTPWLLVPMGLMLVVSLFWVWWYERRSQGWQGQAEEGVVQVENPLAISTAIKFGLAFALVKIVLEVLEGWLGASGVYIASVVAGLTDVDPITLSVAQLARSHVLEPPVAVTAITLAAVTNTLAKAAMARTGGSAPFGRALTLAFGTVAVSGILGGLVVYRLLAGMG